MQKIFDAPIRWAVSALAPWRALRREQPGEFWFACLFWSFWLSLASFPIGYGMREVMPVLSFVFLLLYYRRQWHDSVLRRLGARWLFYCLWLMIGIGVCFSTDPAASLLHAGTGVNKAFILPFIAMECARDARDLRRLVWACALACFWQGLDGVWQAATGRDFIMGYTCNAGRLTGSLGDYTVGNYIALALIPAFGLWFVLRRSLDAVSSAFLCLAVFWPAFFLLQGAASRSGVLAMVAAPAFWALLRRRWRLLLWPLPALGLFILCLGQRLKPEYVIDDGRWSLWHLGWRVFLEHPWFGAGAGQYNAAFRALGLVPVRDEISISHPHNLYLDILYAHGLVGFCLGMIFLLGFLWWGYRRIRPRLDEECAEESAVPYWRLTAWFWIGFAGWLVNGIFGHDFYRIWWLALAMSHLGVMIGAVVNGAAQRSPDGRRAGPKLPSCLPPETGEKQDASGPDAAGRGKARTAQPCGGPVAAR
ncbi:O-antigen ligase family protein [Desulfovibrio sp. SGI.169]|uniref:O-antigen ligase family protein n=1 Tax=Desulfovibrio sp. SGI.169 TaxID=3420561 RepID=UPI003D0611E5